MNQPQLWPYFRTPKCPLLIYRSMPFPAYFYPWFPVVSYPDTYQVVFLMILDVPSLSPSFLIVAIPVPFHFPLPFKQLQLLFLIVLVPRHIWLFVWPTRRLHGQSYSILVWGHPNRSPHTLPWGNGCYRTRQRHADAAWLRRWTRRPSTSTCSRHHTAIARTPTRTSYRPFCVEISKSVYWADFLFPISWYIAETCAMVNFEFYCIHEKNGFWSFLRKFILRDNDYYSL